MAAGRGTPAATVAALVTTAGGEAKADARLQAALDTERELALRECELSRTAAEQQTEWAHLEQLEEVLVGRQEVLDRRESKLHADADAHLIKKRDALEAEFSQEAKDIRAQERGTFTENLKARQADKVCGLKKELDFSK